MKDARTRKILNTSPANNIKNRDQYFGHEQKTLDISSDALAARNNSMRTLKKHMTQTMIDN